MDPKVATRQVEEGSVEVTRLLVACGDGDRMAFDRLVPLVYGELHQIAQRQLLRLRPGNTLGTTGLVHEAYVKLVDQKRSGWKDRNHFYSIAARAMRQILVDYARSKLTEKRGGGVGALPLNEEVVGAPDEVWLLDLHRALERLEQVDARLPQVVECLYFAGYTLEEAAEALGVSTRTVRRDWKAAQAWLREELGGATT